MSEKKEKLLKAAETVVIRQGFGKLTIDAVAAEAGVSKGGLLHHFGTKDQLIEALVQRSADQWREFYRDAYECASEGPGRMTRGLLDHCLTDFEGCTDELCSFSSAVFTTLAQDPNLIKPMREAHTELYELLAQDGLPLGVSEAVVSAINGLWLNSILGLSSLDESRLAHVHQALKDIVATMSKPSV